MYVPNAHNQMSIVPIDMRAPLASSAPDASVSCVQLFENAIFLFFTHPFDVGDVIIFEGDRYRVMAISLQCVNMERVDGADVNVPTAVRIPPPPSPCILTGGWSNMYVFTPYTLIIRTLYAFLVRTYIYAGEDRTSMFLLPIPRHR